MSDDPFASCTETEAAASGMRLGVFEWEGAAALADGRSVALVVYWEPEFDGPLGPVVATARTAWPRVRAAEFGFRRALVDDLVARWRPVLPEDIPPATVRFVADGSSEICYGTFMDGEHHVVVEVSSAGEYLGWRAE